MFRRRKSRAAGHRRPVESLENRTLLSGSLQGETFNYPLGNFTNANLSLNHAAISDLPYGGRLGLTDGGDNEAGSAFTQSKYSLAGFATDFSFQITNAQNGGLSFDIQDSGPGALGSAGSGLGVANIGRSAAVEFNVSGGTSTTDLLVNGVASATTDLTMSGLSFHNGDVISVDVVYEAQRLKVTETDASTPTSAAPATATQIYAVSISQAVGASTAYIGFTGSSGGATPTDSTVEVLNWNFNGVLPADVSVGNAGAVNDSTSASGYVVGAAGTGLGSTSDQVHMIAMPLAGDGTICAQVSPPSSGGAGLTIRDGFNANSAYSAIILNPDGSAVFEYRTATGAASAMGGTVSGLGASTPVMLKLVRNGPTMSGYIAPVAADPIWALVGTIGFRTHSGHQTGLIAWSGSASSLPVHFTKVSLTHDTNVGVDLGDAGQRPKEESQMWVDVMNQATPFTTPVDASGNPTTDFSTGVLVTEANNLGTYHFSMNVKQDPQVSFTGGVISNQTYDPSTGMFNADVTFSKAGVTVYVTATNTGGGATDIQLIRPGYDPNNHPVFTTAYIDMLQALHPRILRFMNYSATNNNPVQTWSQRELPSDATQTETAPLVDFYGNVSKRGPQAKGSSWEYAIMLANEVHADMWINLPAHANADYVQQLANLIKNGDTVGGVHYAGLSPDLNVYIEVSNETWNPGFDANTWDAEAATAEIRASVAPGGTPTNLDYDHLSLATNSSGNYVNGNIFGLRYFAREVLEAGQTFASVFGPGSLTNRIRPVLSAAQPSNLAMLAAYISANYGPPANYLYALGDIIYMNNNGPLNTKNTLNGGFNNPNLTPTDLLNSLAANAVSEEAYYDQVNVVAHEYGLKVDAYEAGIDLSGPADIPARVAAVQLAATTSLLEQDIEHFYSHGGDAFLDFTAEAAPYGSIYGDYQITDDVTNPVTPKFLGIFGASQADRAGLAPAAATGLAATVVSSSEVDLAWTDATGDQTLFRVESSTDSSFASNRLEIDLPATARSYKFTGLAPGITYYFRVVAANTADSSDNPPQVSAQTQGTAAAPAIPSGLSATAVSNSQVNLTWTDRANTETGFHLDVSTSPTFATVVQTITLPADATSASVYSLDAGTQYYFQIRSFNSEGDSANSSVGPVMTLPLTPVAQYEFDESSGTTATDSSSQPDNGSLVGGVTHVPGLTGNALSFDGSTGYVNLKAPGKLNFSGQITISVWIQVTSITQPVYLVSKAYDGQNAPFFLMLTDAQTAVFGTKRITGGTHEASAIAAAPLTDGKWHNIIGTWDGVNFRVYIDGVGGTPVADSYGTARGTGTIALGRNGLLSGTSTYFDGLMDDVQIFDSGISAGDAAAMGL